jgi:FAD/FMN-containing dehydrogenase
VNVAVSSEEPSKFWSGVLAFLCILGVTSGLAAAVVQIDVSGQPDFIVYIVEAVKAVLISTPVALAFGYARNIFGYGNALLKAIRRKEELSYSATWMLQTLTRFEGVVVTATTFIDLVVMSLPPEQKAIAAAATASLWALIEFIFSEAKSFLETLKAT